jgi:ABC-type Zn uptake system ZnuABC Zn-binding protein ZnuA
MRRLGLPVLLVAVACFVAPGTVRPSPVKIAATIFPLADIARQVGGDRVSVTTIIPPGADPHNFEISPSGARAVSDADLVLLMAKHFDGWALGSAQTQKSSGSASPGAPAVSSPGNAAGAPPSVEFESLFEDSLIKTGRDVNPHLWLDPVFARKMAAAVASRLAVLDPANRGLYEEREAAFAARLDSLDASVSVRLESAGFREYVAFHPAWTYFARRYGLIERAVLERTPEQEPSAKWMAQVLRTMKQRGIRVIIAEEFSNRALAETMASDSGARVVVLDPLGASNRPGRDSYVSLIDYNVRLLEEAMRDEASD